MNGQWTPLREILEIAPSLVTLVEHVAYKRASLQPYPRGMILKALKSGFDFPRKRQKQVKAGQFIISKARVHRKIWGIVPPELDGAVLTQNYLVFNIQPRLHPDYFAAYLATPLFRQAAFAARSRRGRLSIRRFARIAIPLPPLEEQQRVAELWKYISTALEHTADMFSSIVEVKSGVANQLFRGVNSSWEHRTLGECAEVGSALSGSNVLSLRPPDQIILGTTLFDEGGVRIAPSLELDGQYLYYYLESQKPALRSALGGAKSGLEDMLRTLPLPLPTLYEQRKIAAVIQQHDEALLWLRAEQAALRQLTQGMMHLIFSGTMNAQDAMPVLRNL